MCINKQFFIAQVYKISITLNIYLKQQQQMKPFGSVSRHIPNNESHYMTKNIRFEQNLLNNTVISLPKIQTFKSSYQPQPIPPTPIPVPAPQPISVPHLVPRQIPHLSSPSASYPQHVIPRLQHIIRRPMPPVIPSQINNQIHPELQMGQQGIPHMENSVTEQYRGNQNLGEVERFITPGIALLGNQINQNQVPQNVKPQRHIFQQEVVSQVRHNNQNRHIIENQVVDQVIYNKRQDKHIMQHEVVDEVRYNNPQHIQRKKSQLQSQLSQSQIWQQPKHLQQNQPQPQLQVQPQQQQLQQPKHQQPQPSPPAPAPPAQPQPVLLSSPTPISLQQQTVTYTESPIPNNYIRQYKPQPSFIAQPAPQPLTPVPVPSPIPTPLQHAQQISNRESSDISVLDFMALEPIVVDPGQNYGNAGTFVSQRVIQPLMHEQQRQDVGIAGSVGSLDDEDVDVLELGAIQPIVI